MNTTFRTYKKYEAAIIAAIPFALLPVAISYHLGWLHYHSLPIIFFSLDFYDSALGLTITAVFISGFILKMSYLLAMAKSIKKEWWGGVPRRITNGLVMAWFLLFVSFGVAVFSEIAAILFILAIPIFVISNECYEFIKDKKQRESLIEDKESLNSDVNAINRTDICVMTFWVVLVAFCLGANMAGASDHYVLAADHATHVIGKKDGYLILKKQGSEGYGQVRLVSPLEVGEIISLKNVLDSGASDGQSSEAH